MINDLALFLIETAIGCLVKAIGVFADDVSDNEDLIKDIADTLHTLERIRVRLLSR